MVLKLKVQITGKVISSSPEVGGEREGKKEMFLVCAGALVVRARARHIRRKPVEKASDGVNLSFTFNGKRIHERNVTTTRDAQANLSAHAGKYSYHYTGVKDGGPMPTLKEGGPYSLLTAALQVNGCVISVILLKACCCAGG